MEESNNTFVTICLHVQLREILELDHMVEGGK